MKRFLLSLVPWMAIGAAAAQTGVPSPAEAVFAFATPKPIAAFRVGDECYVAASALEAVGFRCDVEKLVATVRFGKRAAQIPYRIQSGREVVPLGQVLSQIGAGGAWREDEKTFDAYSVAVAVSVRRGKIEVESSLPVSARMSWLDAPSRLVLDFEGLRRAESTKTTLQDGARAGQYRPNTMRMVVVLDDDKAVAPKAFDAVERFSLDIAKILRPAPANRVAQRGEPAKTLTEPPAAPQKGGQDPKPPAEAGSHASDPVKGQTASQIPPKLSSHPPVSSTTPQSGRYHISLEPLSEIEDGPSDSEAYDKEPPRWLGPKPAKLVSASLAGESAAGSVVVLKFSGPLSKPPLYRRRAPDVLEVVLPGGLAPTSDIAPTSSRFLKGVSSFVGEEGLTLRFELARPLGIQVGNPLNEVHIALIEPKAGGGSLAGKIVVVDAGHGGGDTGAKSPDRSVYEKDLTLSVAKQLAEKLSREGATVLMTRKSDLLIPLKERPEIGNRNQAELFVSVHINSNTRANSSSGGITFYHAQDPVSMLLAECIQSEIAKVSGMPSLGVWSDTRIYDTGFAVLRYAKMPAVLLELGFINHRSDRAILTTPKFQDAATNAIVKGIKVYLGDGQE